MVTFNDRIINLSRTAVPLVGKPRALLSRDPSNRNSNTSSTRMKRQTPSTFARPPYYYTSSARHNSAADAKRRRLKDELNYTAATIQQAFEDAGRPQMPLLTRRIRALASSVNTDGCMLISSTEYDSSTAAAAADADDANDTQDGQSSVDEMLLYASLIQSTRHYYRSVDTASLATTIESINNDEEDDGGDNRDDDDEEEELRASSDTTSTWAPTSSIWNQVNLNDKKTIDNDNRSDGMSSNTASSASGEETSDISFSDQCEGAEASPSPIVPLEKESVNGNLLDSENNNDSDDLNNNGNRDNDGVEDNGEGTATQGARTYFAVG